MIVTVEVVDPPFFTFCYVQPSSVILIFPSQVNAMFGGRNCFKSCYNTFLNILVRLKQIAKVLSR